MTGGIRRVTGSVVMALASLLVVPTGAAAATPEAGSVTVSPNVGLVDEQVVTVAGSGVLADARVQVAQCRTPGTAESDCRVAFGYDDTTDGGGDFSMQARLEADFAPWSDAEPLDCRTAPGTCVLRIDLIRDDDPGGATVQTEIVALSYDPAAPLAPAPTLSVTPSAGLQDGHTVTATGSGWSPDDGFLEEAVIFSTCTTPAFEHGHCAHPAIDDEPVAFVEPDGTFTQEVRLRATFGSGANRTDCRITSCYLVASEEPSFGDQTSVPLDFDPDGPLFDGHVRIEVSPHDDLRDEQQVTVDVSGFYPGERPAIVLECAESADRDFLGCTRGQRLTADVDGRLHLPFAVDERFTDPRGRPVAVDCQVDHCFIGTGRPSGAFPDVRAPITFAGTPVAEPIATSPAFTG